MDNNLIVETEREISSAFKVHFERRPDWREIVTERTFPIDNLGMRTHVNTQLIDKNGATPLTANQEACVLSLENHRPRSSLHRRKQRRPNSEGL